MRPPLAARLSMTTVPCLLLTLILLVGLVAPAGAAVRPQQTGTFSFQLADIAGEEPLLLQGPYDSLGLSFILPQTRLVAGDAVLNLKANVTLATFVIGGGTPPDLTSAEAGTLTVFLNDAVLQTIDIIGQDGIEAEINIPESAFMASGTLNHLRFDLDAGQVCTNNLSIRLELAGDSIMDIPISTEGVSWNLASFPEMFHQPAAVIQPPLAVIVAEDPSLIELNAAANVIAGLARLTDGQLRASLQPLSAVGDAARSDSNFIILGDAALFSDLAPELTEGVDWTEADADTAAIKLMTFPWNAERVVLLGQANTPAAWSSLVAALTLPAIETARDADFATFTAAPEAQAAADYQPSRTLGSLGEGDLVFDRPGSMQHQVEVKLPYGSTISPQSYFDIIISHSDALDYAKSSLVVEVNDTTVSTLTLAGEAGRDHTNRLLLPANAFRPGRNVITFQAELAARDVCADFVANGLQLTLSGESLLNLPVVYQTRPTGLSASLSDFVNVFVSEPLSETRILFPSNEKSLWPAVADLAATLGSKSADSAPFRLDDITNLTQALAGNENVIAVGYLTDDASLAALTDALPMPLNASGLPASPSQVPADVHIAGERLPTYIQLHRPANPQSDVVLTVLGPDAIGVSTAMAALMAPASQDELAQGNVAILQDSNLSAFQVRASGVSDAVQMLPQARPGWLLPLILIAFLGLLALIISGIRFNS